MYAVCTLTNLTDDAFSLTLVATFGSHRDAIAMAMRFTGAGLPVIVRNVAR